MAIGAAVTTQAQQTWYFGNGGGLKFTSGVPGTSAGAVLNTPEGSSVLVDASNNVIMYSDGSNVWNGNHVLQFSGLLGDPSATQAVQIVPIPFSSPAKAFIFTLAEAEDAYGNGSNTSGLRATLVTISGTAPATTLSYISSNFNIRLTDGLNVMGEKMAVTPDGRGGYWLVVHGVGIYDSSGSSGGTGYNSADKNSFYAYNVKCGQVSVNSYPYGTSLNYTEKKSTITNAAITAHKSWDHPSGSGFVMSNDLQFNGEGQMKIVKTSSVTAKVACTLPWAGNAKPSSGYTVNPVAQVYNMNLLTGDIDNASAQQINLGFNHTNTTAKDGTAYGVEFSPNGNYLYVSSTHGSGGFGDMTSRVYQVDLTVPSPTSAVVASLPHANADGFGALQLGPDNKIYIARPGKTFIDVIGSPNNHAASGVGYGTSVAISGICASGLPSPAVSTNTLTTPSLAAASVYCSGQNITVTGGYTGYPPYNQFWEMYGSDAMGNAVDASGAVVPGGPSASWYNTQEWVLGPPGVFTFTNTASIPCNRYYSVKLALTNGCGSWDEVIRTFYLQCTPTPSITSSVANPVCYGTPVNLCVNYTPGGGTVIDWASAVYNYPSPGDNVSCITTGPTQNMTYTAGVTINGCRATSTYSITLRQNYPDFGLAGNLPSGSSPYYNITATPVIPSPSGISYAWDVIQLDAIDNPVTSTEAYNWSCWWTGATNFISYDYTQANGGPPCNIFTAGKFQTDKKYKVTYATWSETYNCPWVSKALTIMIGHGKNTDNPFIIEEAEANDIPQSVTGIATIANKEESLFIYPNPSNGVFHLQCPDKTKKDIYVYDVMGRSVFAKTQVAENLVEINLENQPKGIYFIDILSDGKKTNRKIIVQ